MALLFRTLFSVRGLILAGTITLAAIGSYFDQQTAPSGAVVGPKPAVVHRAEDTGRPQAQWKFGDPCPAASTPYSATACWL